MCEFEYNMKTLKVILFDDFKNSILKNFKKKYLCNFLFFLIIFSFYYFN